jgi:hypothetical protein
MFAKRNREMPERNRLQAMFPEGSDEVFNPQGTAPGVDLAVPRSNRPASRIFALPGVPAEMKRMFATTNHASESRLAPQRFRCELQPPPQAKRGVMNRSNRLARKSLIASATFTLEMEKSSSSFMPSMRC